MRDIADSRAIACFSDKVLQAGVIAEAEAEAEERGEEGGADLEGPLFEADCDTPMVYGCMCRQSSMRCACCPCVIQSEDKPVTRSRQPSDKRRPVRSLAMVTVLCACRIWCCRITKHTLAQLRWSYQHKSVSHARVTDTVSGSCAEHAYVHRCSTIDWTVACVVALQRPWSSDRCVTLFGIFPAFHMPYLVRQRWFSHDYVDNAGHVLGHT